MCINCVYMQLMLAAVEYQSDPDVSTTFSPNCRQPPKVIGKIYSLISCIHTSLCHAKRCRCIQVWGGYY